MVTQQDNALAASQSAPSETYQVLVSYYAGADFVGDWRWSADCPAVGCASNGRTRQEALEMVKDAVQGLLADYPPGQYPYHAAAVMAQVRAEYDANGWQYDIAQITVSGLNPYRSPASYHAI